MQRRAIPTAPTTPTPRPSKRRAGSPAEGRTMAWILLISAGLLETGFAVSLDQSEGFTRPVPTVLFALCAIASFALLNLALRDLPVGTAYAVWTGIGAAGTAIVGMVALDEPANATRIVAIGLIVAGAVSLQAVERH
jgi:quaternary ammonium compound-resistance protein SugE